MKRLIFASVLALSVCACAPVSEKAGPGKQTDYPILNETVFGAYGVEGKDYKYERGVMQLSRVYSKDGRTVTFCILDNDNSTVYSLSGVLVNAQKGDSFVTKFTIAQPNNTVKELSGISTVIAVSGETLWLKSADDVFYIVKK